MWVEMCTIEINQLSNEKGIKIIHLNARSRFHKLEDIFHNFYYCDVIVITETWLTCNIPMASISVDGFSVIRQDRYENSCKKGGGICIYVKKEFSYENLLQVSVSTTDYETLGIKLKIKNIKPLFILGIYRPPMGNLNTCVDWSENNVEGIDLIRAELFVPGDMNIDYNNSKLV